MEPTTNPPVQKSHNLLSKRNSIIAAAVVIVVIAGLAIVLTRSDKKEPVVGTVTGVDKQGFSKVIPPDVKKATPEQAGKYNLPAESTTVDEVRVQCLNEWASNKTNAVRANGSVNLPKDVNDQLDQDRLDCFKKFPE